MHEYVERLIANGARPEEVKQKAIGKVYKNGEVIETLTEETADKEETLKTRKRKQG